LGLHFEANLRDKETFEGASFSMFFSFCARARGEARIVHRRGEKWICIGAIYWLDGRSGARGVGSDRGARTRLVRRSRSQAHEDGKGNGERGIKLPRFGMEARSPPRNSFTANRSTVCTSGPMQDRLGDGVTEMSVRPFQFRRRSVEMCSSQGRRRFRTCQQKRRGQGPRLC
jgi:hypothetical protein